MSELISWIIVGELAILTFGIFSIKNDETTFHIKELLRSIEKIAKDIREDIGQHSQSVEAELQSIEHNISRIKEHVSPSNLVSK